MFPIQRHVQEFRYGVGEVKYGNRVGSQFVYFACILRQIDYEGYVLQQEEAQMNRRVDFAEECRAGREAEKVMADQLHQLDVRHQVGHEAGVFILGHLHLMGANEREAKREENRFVL